MVKEPYKVLGLDKDAPAEQLEAKYNELKAIYGEQRFLAGEEGNEGARKLMELEEAWSMIKSDLDRLEAKEKFGGDFGQIDNLIKSGKYDEAQAALDEITDRNAEWHYFQSIVFYKRDWLTESRKQLEQAIELDPRNDKYKTALDKLKMVMGSADVNPQTLGGQPNGQAMPQQDPGMMGGNCLANCCCAYCLTDCCCNLMQCCG